MQHSLFQTDRRFGETYCLRNLEIALNMEDASPCETP
jgi:hypothetical protein